MSAGMVMLAACTSDGKGAHASGRGAGLDPASLPASASAAAYAAALGQAFDIGPGLVLLLDPTLLPSAGSGNATRELAPDVARRLRSTGVTQGTCEPRPGRSGAAPTCAARMAGYVVRVSDIFRLARDTVQLYVTAERYRPARDSTHFASPLRFEQRYSLARHGGGWVVVTQERLVHVAAAESAAGSRP